MATVENILAQKDNRIHTTSQTATVLEATQLMNQFKIGSLVVVSGSRVAGIFTERDVLRRVVAQEKCPSETLIRDVMTSAVMCCRNNTTIEDVRGMMTDRKIRHVPVINEEDNLVGLISIGDLNAFRANQRQIKIEYLEEYLYGRV